MTKHTWYLIFCCYTFFLKISFLLVPIRKIDFRFLNIFFFFSSLYTTTLNVSPCILLQFTASYGLLCKIGQGNWWKQNWSRQKPEKDARGILL